MEESESITHEQEEELNDIPQKALAKYKQDVDNWANIYTKAREDMHFLSDSPYAQWHEKDYSDLQKLGRPALTIDQLGQFVHKVANDIRMNTPTINIIPDGNNSDTETAEIFRDYIKNIEYRSKADEAYDTAALNAVKSSIGFIRVDHDYINNTSFDQELVIKRVVNPLNCILDSNSIEGDGSDAMHAFIIEEIPVSEFKRRYPNFDPISFDANNSNQEKKSGDYMKIALYYQIEEETKIIGLMESGDIEELNAEFEYKSTREIKRRKVYCYVLSGKDVLEKTTFPGKYIPLVPVYGEEAWVDGKRELYSLIRKSKDAQRMYNRWKSLETELLMKAPIAPVMVAEGQIEDYAEDWKNPSKSMALRYKVKDSAGNPVGAPQRLAPPQVPTGIVNAARATVDDIKASMGLYNASIGQASNETSGIAITRRKEEGDVATYHFGDNLVRSITQVGLILVCAIPDVIDTPRIINTINMEGEANSVGVNGEAVRGQKRLYDLREGEYSVRVTTGASSATKRQEAAEVMSQIITKNPQLMNVIGDLLFKNMDFPGAEAVADRIQRTIPPQLLAGENDGQEVDAEKRQMAQTIEQGKIILAQMQAQMQEMQDKLDSKDRELAIKAKAEENDAASNADKLKLEYMKLQVERDKIESEKEFKARALAIKEQEVLMKQQTPAAVPYE